SRAMKAAIRQKALELGFDDCRFTSAAAPDSADKLVAWLAQGWHGEMAYLHRNAHKRVDPDQVLPGSRSIITLAASYLSAPAQAGAVVSAAGRSHTPAGFVARYARFADYHDLIGKLLANLTAFITNLAPGARSLWYVDTGPL